MIEYPNNWMAMDSETTGLNHYGDFKTLGFYPARPFAWSFSNLEFDTEYFRVPVNPMNRDIGWNGHQFTFRQVKTRLEDPTKIKIGHNIGFDIRMARSIGIEVKGEIHDTLIMAHVFTGGALLSYGLKELGIKFADFPDDDEKELKEATRKARAAGKKLGWCLATKEHHGKEPIKADYWMAPEKLCEKYAVQDAQRTMLFFQAWYEKIMNDNNMKRVYEREMKLLRVVSSMENLGTRYFPEDGERLRKFYTKYRDDQFKIAEKDGHKICRGPGEEGLNTRSPTQMVKKFIDEKGYEGIYFTPKGNPKINGDTLKIWAEEKNDVLAKAILESKGASHMISGFLDPYDRFRVKEDEKTWVLHPNFRQCGPVTGRFSCIAKGTKVEVVGGRGKIPIENVRVGDYVYTYNKEMKLCIRKVNGVLEQGIRKVIRVHWLAGGRHRKGYLDLTPEHKILKTSGKWCKAINLKRMDRVMALGRSQDNDRYDIYPTGGVQESEQRFVCSWFYGLKEIVHHKDEDPLNNYPNNLEPLTRKEHKKIHPITKKQHDSWSKSMKERWERGEFKIKYGKDNPFYGKHHSKEIIEKANKTRALLRKENKDHNHIITKIENLNKKIQVYDLRVEKDHCFIAGELVVHNCGDPNLMQVASETTGRRRTEITLRPREAFGPRDGYVWYMPDYSQIEVWVFSFLSQEKAMMKALLEGRDFHGSVGEKVWGNHPRFQEDKAYFRKRAKLLMFGKIYGAGSKKVAYLTDSTVKEAEKFIAEFDRELPGVSTFMKRMINKAENEGKIVNPLGRTYYIEPDFAYKAVNYLVQGTSADILKNAMIRIHNLFQEKWQGCNILLTLHDELVMEIPLKYHSKKLMREIITEMQRDSVEVGIPVPLPVGMKIAKSRWSDTVEIESLSQEWKDRYICKKTT